MRILICILALALILGLVLHYGGLFTFDAVAEAAKARAAIKPGMSWEKVVTDAAKPRNWRIYIEKKTNIAGFEQVMYAPGPEGPYDHDAIADRVADGTLPGGFSFRYDFHNARGGSFIVKFDAQGNVEDVHDAVNLGVLLDQ